MEDNVKNLMKCIQKYSYVKLFHDGICGSKISVSIINLFHTELKKISMAFINLKNTSQVSNKKLNDTMNDR